MGIRFVVSLSQDAVERHLADLANISEDFSRFQSTD